MHQPTSTHPADTFDPLAGPFTSAGALAAGLSRWDLGQLLRDSLVRRPLRDLYIPADVPDDLESRAQAASLVIPAHAVAVDRTAAWIWGVDARTPSALDLPPRPEFFVLRGHSRLRRSGLDSGERDLAADDIARVGKILVTVPARASLDLGCRLGAYDALAAMDAFDRAHGISAAVLLPMLPRFRGRRGVVQVRELVPLVDGRVESAGESFVRRAMFEAGLPMPQPQYTVMLHGITYRLDLAYPRLKICIEYDGEEFHDSDEARLRDERRRRRLREAGWTVIVVRKDGFKGPGLEAWLKELRSEIAERSRRGRLKRG